MLCYKEYDNALAVEIVIKGFVSTKEFEDTAKKPEDFIARHGKVNALEVIEDFEGMDGAAFWEDLKFTLRHLNDFSRCAIVSAGKWVTPWSEIIAPFFKGEVRYFPPDEIEAAASGCCFLATRSQSEVFSCATRSQSEVFSCASRSFGPRFHDFVCAFADRVYRLGHVRPPSPSSIEAQFISPFRSARVDRCQV